jgi:hypothetical protein
MTESINRSRLIGAAGIVGAVAVLAVALGLVGASPASARNSPKATCPGSAAVLAQYTYTPAIRAYDDPVGDSGNAPDFCAAEFVTNDNEAVMIGIHAHNRSGYVAGDGYAIFLDIDQNPSTGGAGAEYLIALGQSGAAVSHWNGTSFDTGSAVPVPTEWADGYGPLVAVPRSALGDPTAFNAVFVSVNGDDVDRAPDTGSWAYTVAPLTLEVKSLSLGPARAGRPFVARALVVSSDFDQPLTDGTIACAAKLAGRPLRGTGRFVNDRVACTWRLPRSARGKRLSGSVAVTYQGVQAKRTFSVRVK